MWLNIQSCGLYEKKSYKKRAVNKPLIYILISIFKYLPFFILHCNNYLFFSLHCWFVIHYTYGYSETISKIKYKFVKITFYYVFSIKDQTVSNVSIMIILCFSIHFGSITNFLWGPKGREFVYELPPGVS